jgi:hypothetical protein
MSLKEMRDELRTLRKTSTQYKPVSRLAKKDISNEIQRLKALRSDTPAVAAQPSGNAKVSRSAVENIKAAKAAEFPIKPDSTAATKKKTGAAPLKKKMTMEEKLAKALKMMEDDDDE